MFKIVQILPSLIHGGAQIFCIQLCNELANYPNYEVTLISMYDHNVKDDLPLSVLDKKIKLITLGKKEGLDLKIFLRISRQLRRIRPNVVHTHLHSCYYATFSYLMIRKFSFKKIHTFHSLVTKDAPWHKRKVYKFFFKAKIIHAVSISEEVFKGAIKEYGQCIKTLIHNGSIRATATPLYEEVSKLVKKLKKDNHTKVLINVASIYKVKNQQLILKAMKALELEKENVIALIIGNYLPQDKSFYEQLIKIKPGNVFFLGKVNNVGDYLLNSNAFLLSSLYEGLPISLLEALSVGVIPICTPVGGLLDVVKKDIGFLSEDISESLYLKAIKYFLHADKKTVEILSENCKALYNERFSMKSCAAKYIQLYLN